MVNGTWRWAVGGWPHFVFGWREVFVPLVILMHNQHGPSLAVVGLAVAATRLGGWLWHKSAQRRSLREAGLLCGIALLFLGVAPEEGPIGLLLWFLFGLGWPALLAGLTGRTWQGWMGLAALVAGLLAAAPLARGPGAWLIAAGCLLLAWQAGPWTAQLGEAAQPEKQPGQPWTPFLFSVAYLGWVWLLPAQLGAGTLAPELFAVTMAGSWLARSLSATACERSSNRRFDRARRTVAALALLPALAVVALASQPLWAALAMVLCGGLLGVISTGPGIARAEQGQRPNENQALGEWVGPLLGAGLVLVGGPSAVFAGAALAAAALTWTLLRS